MRLFVAVELGDATRAAIHREQRRLLASWGADAAALRPVREEHLHLTLVFLGDVSADRFPQVGEALTPPLELPPYRLRFGSAGVFPQRGAPRVLWLDITDGREETVRLHAILAARLRAFLQESGGTFTPHVTLARWRKDGTRRRLPLTGAAGAVPPVDVREVALVESRLSAAGPAYTALMRTPLACP